MAALMTSAVASSALLLLPLVASETSGSPARRLSLLEAQGWTVAVTLAVPVLLAAVPPLLPPGARRPGTLVVTFLLTAGVVLGLLSIGLFYLPTVILLVVALIRSDSVPT